jgi:hypothetical protein
LHRDKISAGQKPSQWKVCVYCKNSFATYDKTRKYCSHQCYIANRFGRALPPKREEPELELIEGILPEHNIDESDFLNYYKFDEQTPIMLKEDIGEDKEIEPKRVFLLTGSYNFRGKFDHFAGLLPLTAQEQLSNGDVFIYCNSQRTQLGILQWQGDGFALFFKRIEFEHYPWPFWVKHKLVEISPTDLRMLLEYPRFVKLIYGIQNRMAEKVAEKM